MLGRLKWRSSACAILSSPCTGEGGESNGGDVGGDCSNIEMLEVVVRHTEAWSGMLVLPLGMKDKTQCWVQPARNTEKREGGERGREGEREGGEGRESHHSSVIIQTAARCFRWMGTCTAEHQLHPSCCTRLTSMLRGTHNWSTLAAVQDWPPCWEAHTPGPPKLLYKTDLQAEKSKLCLFASVAPGLGRSDLQLHHLSSCRQSSELQTSRSPYEEHTLLPWQPVTTIVRGRREDEDGEELMWGRKGGG